MCSGRRPCACSSLAVLRPGVAAGWDLAANGPLQPTDVPVSSGKVVRWVCTEHQPAFTWSPAISDRTRASNASGCPECAKAARTKPLQRETPCSRACSAAPAEICSLDLQMGCAGQPTLTAGHPELAAQWHPNRNGDVKPEKFASGSGQKVWWLCTDAKCGHQHKWEAKISARAKSGTGCPICAGRKPCICSSLAALHPEAVSAEWDYDQHTVRPEDLLSKSDRKIHWRCAHHQPSHSWTASPHQRFGHAKSGCPLCARLRQRAPASLQ